VEVDHFALSSEGFLAVNVLWPVSLKFATRQSLWPSTESQHF